ncbi:MAG: CBS domain-containing protein, partial [Longimicrobiales bacterium]|nr:CBS domain-containing protein [Longimicrobiales bacterium]
MKIRDILGKKGRFVVTIPPDRTVLEAIRLLVEKNIGSVVVTNDDSIVGILTERDILRLTTDRHRELDRLLVSETMTSEVITATPDDEISHVMEVMTENRIRHLPVLEDHGLAGILSIGDVVNALRESVQSENQHLK